MEIMEIDTMINLEEVEKIIKKESEKLFGDSNYYKQSITQITEHIHLLKKKIHELD